MVVFDPQKRYLEICQQLQSEQCRVVLSPFIGAPEVDALGASASEKLQSRQRLEFENRVVPTF